MIAIIDYGVGNIFSLKSSFDYIGENAQLTSDFETIKKADKLILPGVGAFGDAIAKLKEKGLADLIISETQKGKPILGICLGMQLLFDESSEYGQHAGLGLIQGNIVSMEGAVPKDYKVPHIGWNQLHFPRDKENSPIFKYVNEGDSVYFVHTYYGRNCEASTIATTEYGEMLTAAVGNGNVFGVQFHPEKSGKIGLNILKAFSQL